MYQTIHYSIICNCKEDWRQTVDWLTRLYVQI